MNLFEKIDLFEKMAIEAGDDNTINKDSEVIDNIDEYSQNHETKASIRARLDLLKMAGKF